MITITLHKAHCVNGKSIGILHVRPERISAVHTVEYSEPEGTITLVLLRSGKEFRVKESVVEVLDLIDEAESAN